MENVGQNLFIYTHRFSMKIPVEFTGEDGYYCKIVEILPVGLRDRCMWKHKIHFMIYSMFILKQQPWNKEIH